jgi:hypothetical protein
MELAPWECLIARCDELLIEEEFLGLLALDTDVRLSRKLCPVFRDTLHRIDRLKIAGHYDAERERLLQAANAAGEWPFIRTVERWVEASWSNWPGWRNLLDGLKSPDVDQRARFQAFWDAWDVGEKFVADPKMLTLLAVLERAKQGRKDNKKISPPWRNEVSAMDEMRLLDPAGVNILKAAREVAPRHPGQGGTLEGRAHTLAALYRKRRSLRDLPPGLRIVRK